MLNQKTSVENVADVIQVMRAGVDFYQDAVEKVNSSSLKGTFTKMATKKAAAIQALQPLAIAEQGEIEDGNSIAVETRKIYTKFVAMFSSDEDYTYIKQLEEVEDKVLEVLDDAIAKNQQGQALLILTNIRVDAQSMHDEMKTLQQLKKN
ncbi:PA2169 family four-helix-bundle protein [Shewanella sp. OMA3-2]|uniref:PA2169 family four-helix-bundle protein n=1 Tax=Shewanella sp. OMA3-2 TaxID=2908650 RepID=UPI001F1B0187|nr:PA2169 family four-helix-bundle protein [Shewanella sp. OMA3-2]UJF20507.1 PA2169 family four-helix-bundle protein [Shewanella sp. OMA3-2]